MVSAFVLYFAGRKGNSMGTNENKSSLKSRIKRTAKKWLMVILNPRLLLCLFIGWMITNGWSYVFFTLGMYFDITWMYAIGLGYMSMLWAPFTPEKIITVIIALFLMRVIFPQDEKTIGVLRSEVKSLKASLKRQHAKRRDKRQERKKQRAEKRALKRAQKEKSKVKDNK